MTRKISMILLLLAAVAGAVELPRQLPNPAAINTAASLWDFSAAEVAAVAARVDCYGDSLLCEDVDGEIRWYEISAAGRRLVSRENRLMHCAFGDLLQPMSGESAQSFAATGRYCGSNDLRLEGVITTSVPADGALIIAVGDTIAATMVAERMVFSARLGGDVFEPFTPLEADTLDCYTITSHRWFAAHSATPVAILTTTEAITADGTRTPMTASAFCIDAAELPCSDSSPDSPITVTTDANTMTIALAADSQPTSITAAITTIDGLPCLSAQFILQPGTSYTISTASLPYGRYVATIATATATSRRYFSRQ
ncbi:MAG: hypothetical protein ACI391_00335 [Muribaculaceae bacterium]